jgi:hypothetical protein
MTLPVMRRCRGDVEAMVFLPDYWAERLAMREVPSFIQD